MNSIIEAESTLTDRYQTTVPESIRNALRLSKRDKIHYTVRANGEVVLSRSEASDVDDPVVTRFLDFLAQDMMEHPERLQGLDASLVERVKGLVEGIELDLDAPLSADDE